MAQLTPCAAGYHRHLPEDETEMRGRGANFNPVSIPKEGEGTPVYTRADDLAPLVKTDQAMRQYGRDSDAALIAGIKRKQPAHPSRQTGVHASHALSKCPGWNEEKSHNPDPMHTSTNEYGNSSTMADGEIFWGSISQVEGPGWICLGQPLLHNSKLVERCKGMRVRDEVCCLPLGMTTVHFEKAFGVGGQLKSAEYLLLAGPYGKYLMQGCFHSEVQAAVFKHLHYQAH
ncbi:hypothetical protein WJX77_002792 [Trebouxia sp. C0004]